MTRIYLLSLLFLAGAAVPLTAQCTAPTATAPAVESFENGLTGLNNVTEPYPGYAFIDATVATAPSSGNGPVAALDGTDYLSIKFPTATTNGQDWGIELVSDCYDLSGLSQPQLHLPFFRGNGGSFTSFFQISGDGGQTWVYPAYDAETYPKYAGPANREAGWYDFFLDLSPVAGSTNFMYRIGIIAAPDFDQELAIDAVRIGEALCAQPFTADLTAYTTSGAADGSIDLTVTGGQGARSFTWSTGATTEDLSGLSPGNYTVRVTDEQYCLAEAGIYVSDPVPTQGTKNGGYPYFYDFEKNGLGLLRQNTGDSHNWARRRNDTPTPSTGPQPFISFPAGSQFRYLEAGNGSTVRTAVMTTKRNLNLTALSQPVTEVSYHLYGTDQGTFAIEASPDGGASWRRVFSATGSQGWFWQTARVDLGAFNGGQTQVRLVAVTSGEGPASDIAVDSFYVGESAPALTQSAAKALAAAPDDAPAAHAWWDGSPALLLHREKAPRAAVPQLPVRQPAAVTAAPKALAAGSCSLCVLEDDIFRVAPNPVRSGGEITLTSLAEVDGAVTVSLPLTGQTLYRGEVTGNPALRLPLPRLATGLHLVHVQYRGATYPHKIIVY